MGSLRRVGARAALGYGGAAQTHVHKYDTSVTRLYNQIAVRRGRRSAVVAAAHKLLLICYSVLRNKRPYYDQAKHIPRLSAV